MKPEERQQLRRELLAELYEYNFSNKGIAKPIVQEIRKDVEKKLAYEYLYEKGLIHYNIEVAGRDRNIIRAEAKITANGTDVAEDERKLALL